MSVIRIKAVEPWILELLRFAADCFSVEFKRLPLLIKLMEMLRLI
jgi:hypothetical protein